MRARRQAGRSQDRERCTPSSASSARELLDCNLPVRVKSTLQLAKAVRERQAARDRPSATLARHVLKRSARRTDITFGVSGAQHAIRLLVLGGSLVR